MSVKKTAAAGGTAIALAVLVFTQRHEIAPTGRALGDANPLWLLGAAVMLVVWISAWTFTHHLARRATGITDGPGTQLVGVVLASVAANSLVTAGGMAGITAFDRHARRRNQSVGLTHGAYAVATIAVDIAFTVVLVAGLVALLVDNVLTATETWATAVVIGVLVLKTAVVITAAQSRRLLHRLYGLGPALWNRLRRQTTTVPDMSSADELYDAMAVLRKSPRRALPAVLSALLIDVAGVGMLWCAIAAVNGGDRLSTALIVYTVSSLFAVVSILPGGIGFVEVGAAGTLTTFGLPLHTASAAVILFRIFEFWLPVAIGALYASRLAHSSPRQKDHT